MANSDITLVIKGDSSKLLAALNKAGAAVNHFSDTAEKTTNKGSAGFRRLTGAVTVAAGTLAAGAISRGIGMISNSINDAVRRVDTLNNFPKVMSNVGISADKARAAITKATKGILGLPTSLDMAAQSIQRLTMKTKDVDKATDLFLALNNAILAGGAAPQIQAAAMEQLSQAFARGKPDLIEWRAAMTAAPAQMDQLAKAMGKVDALALYEDIRDGVISMDQLGDALIRLNTSGAGGLPTFAEQAKNATGGIATGMENAKTAVVRGVSKIIEAMGSGDMSSGFGSMGTAIEGVLNKIAVLVKFVKENQTAFTILAGVLGSVVAVVKVYDFYVAAATKATKMWASATKLLSKESKTAQVAIGLFNLAVKASPILIAVTAIAALAAGFVWLWNNVEGFRNFFIGAWEVIKAYIGSISPILSAVASALSAAAGVIVGTFSTIANVIGKNIRGIVNVITGIASAVWNAISPVVGFFSGVFGLAWRIVSSTFILIVAIVATFAETVFKIVAGITLFFVNNFSAISDFISGIVMSITGFFVQAFSAIYTAVSTFVGTVIGFFSGMLNAITGAISSFMGVVISAVSTIVSSIMSVVSPIVDWTNSTIIQPIAGFFGWLWGNVMAGVSGFVGAIINAIAPVAGWINGNVIQPIARFFGGLWNGVVGGVRAAAGAIQNVMGSIAGVIKAPINGVIGAINNVIAGINRIKVPDWVPGLGGKSPNFPTIPRLATGGIVTPQNGGSIIYAGDGGQNEWVVPESKMASLIDQVNRRMSGTNVSKNITINNTYNVRDRVDSQMVASDLGYLLTQA